jgi:hypothetical protein
MKGQLVFEFVIAGIIFFSVVLYAMNYLNTNVSVFRERFYADRLQSKALQISDILGNENSPLGIVERPLVFDTERIENFNSTYCGYDGYGGLREDFELVEKTAYGERLHNVNIILATVTGTPLLQCGYTVPAGTEKAEVERFGILDENNELVRMKIVVW